MEEVPRCSRHDCDHVAHYRFRNSVGALTDYCACHLPMKAYGRMSRAEQDEAVMLVSQETGGFKVSPGGGIQEAGV